MAARSVEIVAMEATAVRTGRGSAVVRRRRLLLPISRQVSSDSPDAQPSPGVSIKQRPGLGDGLGHAPRQRLEHLADSDRIGPGVFEARHRGRQLCEGRSSAGPQLHEWW